MFLSGLLAVGFAPLQGDDDVGEVPEVGEKKAEQKSEQRRQQRSNTEKASCDTEKASAPNCCGPSKSTTKKPEKDRSSSSSLFRLLLALLPWRQWKLNSLKKQELANLVHFTAAGNYILSQHVLCYFLNHSKFWRNAFYGCRAP